MGFPEIPWKPTPAGEPCKACGHPRSGLKASITISWLEHLQANADNGCQLCFLIVQGIERCLSPNEIPEDTTLKLEINLFGTACLQVTIFDAPVTLSFVLTPESPLSKVPCFGAWSPGFAVPSSTDSDESVAWVRECLRQCDASHELCKPTWSVASLPTRVLDVGSGPEDTVKLILTNEEMKGRYICLSHRWGEVTARRPLCRTLKSNLVSHQRGLVWADLPATFRDAIQFTRQLGVRYIWIDSLCILQDDRDDWRREGSKMASIYSNAYLTLAAAHGDGSGSPMFASLEPKFALHPLSIPECIIPEEIRSNTIEGYGAFVRHSMTHTARPSLLQTTGPQPFPLLRRGWVFQERLLSPRTLFFGSEELSWECVEQHACQCTGTSKIDLPISPADWARDYAQHIASPKRFHNLSTLQHTIRDRGKQAMIKRWTTLVEDYMELDLTFDRDIFPALSGLVRAYSSVFGGRYCAGLWEDFLLEGLVWHVHGTTERWMNPPEEWRSPSWSWAAVKAPVNFLVAEPLEEKCEVLDIVCRPSGPDPTGELDGGYIVLRGLMFASTFQYLNHEGSRAPHKVFDLEAFPSLGERKFMNNYADYDICMPGVHRLPEGTELAYFLVGKKQSPESFYFLILKPTGESPEGSLPVYKRVGMTQLLGLPGNRTNTEPTFFDTWVEEQGEIGTIMII